MGLGAAQRRLSAGARVILVAVLAMLHSLPVEAAGQGGPLDSLRRLIRRFDFEEANEVPTEMPDNFYRVLTRHTGRTGFPDFGQMRLDNSVASSGRWSFRFELNGGSIAAALAPAVIPIFPGSDYRVTGMVRTEGLVHARARIAARLIDEQGAALPNAEFFSPELLSDRAWTPFAIDVSAQDPAADLVLELQLLQPRERLRDAAGELEPLLEDVKGTAWFDDVSVWLVPRIEFTSSSGSTCSGVDEPLSLRIGVHDVSTERLTVDVRIYDLFGHLVQEAQGLESPSGGRALLLPFGPQQAGWYRAVLDVRNSWTVVAQERLDIARLAPSDADAPALMPRFGVALSAFSEGELEASPALLELLGAQDVIVPIWFTGSREALPPADILRRFTDELLDRNIEPTMAIGDLPMRIAEVTNLDPSQSIEYLAMGPREWRTAIEEVLLMVGQHLPRWQLGDWRRSTTIWSESLDEKLQTAAMELQKLVPNPSVILPWAGELEPMVTETVRGWTITFPPGSGEAAILDAASRFSDRLNDCTAVLDTLPAQEFSEEDRVVDLALRTVAAWRAGFPRLMIPSPWVIETGHQVHPSPEFAAWRELAHRLEGKVFGGEMQLGDGLRCLIAQGDSDSSLIAWNESAPPERAHIALALAQSSITVVDLFGNRSTIDPVGNIHTVSVNAMPVFIEEVDAGLAQFRGGFAFEPSLVPSLHQVHEHELVISNPFDVTISGSIRIVEPVDWEFSPRQQTFTIPPRQTQRLPVSLSFPRSELAGMKKLVAQVQFNGERTYDITLEAPIELGLDSVQFQAHWRLAEGVDTGRVDLVIYEHITNTGAVPISLEAFAVAPGYHHKRKPIVDLPPGQSAVRIFDFPDGREQLRGRVIRVGVSEIQGPGRLNREIRIPQ